MTTKRRAAADQRLNSDARKLWSEMVRNEAKAEAATAVAHP